MFSMSINTSRNASARLSYSQQPSQPYAAQAAADPTATVKISGSIVTAYSTPYTGFTSTTGGTQQLSPAGAVAQGNSNSAGWLVTCPQAPESNPTNDQYFYTGSSPYIGGDACQATSSPLTTSYNMPTTISWSSTNFATASVSQFVISNPANVAITPLAYSPEVGNSVSSSYGSDFYIFQKPPTVPQQSIWTWNAKYANFGNIPPQSSSYSGTFSYSEQVNGNTCTYTYSYSESTNLQRVSNYQIPFITQTPVGKQYTFNTPVLPYFTYGFNIITPSQIPTLNLTGSYDVYSPDNYYNPAVRTDPFTFDTPALFYADSKGTLEAFNRGNGVSIDFGTTSNIINPNIQTGVTTSPGSTSIQGCPNQYYTPGSQNTLTLAQIVSCVSGAGFTGSEIITLSSMAMQESGFNPGALESCSTGGDAMGLFQIGSNACPSPYAAPDPIAGYNPLTCSSYAQYGWLGVYDNPTCAAKWSYAEFTYWGDNFWDFWGSYRSGAYCNWAPSGWVGGGQYGGVQCNGGLNAADLPWSTVCPDNVCPSSSSSSGSPSPTSNSIIPSPISITTTPSGYILLVGNTISSSSSTTPSGEYAYPVGSSCNVERTDQGKDWGGSCPLYAIGSGTITNLYNSGWPGLHTFIVLQLNNPPESNSMYTYVYYAEDVNPSVSIGEKVNTGQVIGQATGGSTGIEIGFAAPPPDTGESLNAQLNGPYSGSGPTPEGTNFVNFIDSIQSGTTTSTSTTTSSGYALYVLKPVTEGNYNTSNYQPDSVQSPVPSASTWYSNWNTYWKNVIKLQNGATYFVNQVDLNSNSICKSLTGASGSVSGISVSLQPYNVSVDDQGTAYISAGCTVTTQAVGFRGLPTYSTELFPALIKVVNAITSNSPVVTGNVIQNLPNDKNNHPLNEITASPSGSLVFMANQSIPYIYVFDGSSLKYGADISLQYTIGAGSEVDGHSTAPVLNIYQYLYEGGLYGANASMTVTNPAFATTEDYKMEKALSSVTEKNNALDVPQFHHPVAIQDINGYLYVLDNWEGQTGGNCGIHIIFCFSSSGGVNFEIVTLRVINTTGVDAKINPTKSDDISPSSYTSPSNNYPPYGWVITANISANNGDPSAADINFCGAANPPCYTIPASSASNYGSAYKPIGPLINSWICTGELCSIGEGYHVPPIRGPSMSINSNGTMALLMPNIDSRQGPGNAADYGELMISRFLVENYTKFTGYNGSISPFNCYVDNKAYAASSPSEFNPPFCTYLSSLDDLSNPIYFDTSALNYTESISSEQGLTYAGYYFSSFSGSQQAGSASDNSIAAQSENSIASSFNSNPFKLNPSSAITGILYGSQLTALNGQLSGYVLVPYTYTYTESQQYSGGGLSSGPSSCPSSVTLPASGTKTYTEYSFASSNTVNSNTKKANIASGQTYVKYPTQNSYYVPNISDSQNIISPFFIYNVQTDRKFGNIYINATTSPTSNLQDVINGTHLINFFTKTYSQGAYPGYSTVGYSVIPENQICYGVGCVSSLIGNLANAFNQPNNFTYTEYPQPATVTLFDLYKEMVNDNRLTETIKKSTGAGSNSLFGYHRLLFVYNDQFNNKIYMPVDADIANITQVDLNVVPSVNSLNSNQTTLYINGTAGFQPISGNFIPLKGGSIYLYYDTNLNYYTLASSPESPSGAAQADICAFGNTINGNCQVANPSLTGDGQWSNVVTYHSSYNALSPGTCIPPANSLLQTPKYDCNIYGSFKTSSGSTVSLPKTGTIDGNTAFCDPYFSNGTGLLTSQMGLIGIATTNSIGNFSLKTTACGTGFAQVTAIYYGAPGNQPAFTFQAALPYSANPNTNTNYAFSFNQLSYTWAPNNTAESIPIGLLLLNYGNIYEIPAIAALAAVAVLALLRSKGTKSSGRRRRRNNR